MVLWETKKKYYRDKINKLYGAREISKELFSSLFRTVNLLDENDADDNNKIREEHILYELKNEGVDVSAIMEEQNEYDNALGVEISMRILNGIKEGIPREIFIHDSSPEGRMVSMYASAVIEASKGATDKLDAKKMKEIAQHASEICKDNISEILEDEARRVNKASKALEAHSLDEEKFLSLLEEMGMERRVANAMLPTASRFKEKERELKEKALGWVCDLEAFYAIAEDNSLNGARSPVNGFFHALLRFSKLNGEVKEAVVKHEAPAFSIPLLLGAIRRRCFFFSGQKG